MRKTSPITSVILTLLLLSLATEKSLMAYADPGSGAMFVQILLAGMIGVAFRIRKIFTRFLPAKKTEEPQKFPKLSESSLTQSPK
jgi:hypothetical protein